MKLVQIKLLLITLFISQLGLSQVTTYTTTINVDGGGQDAMVVSAGSANVNYGTDRYINVHKNNGRTAALSRTFIEFDLSSIPTNAIITSATLQITPSVVYTATTFNYSVERADASWGNGTLTWNNQPGTYTSDAIEVVDPASASASVHNINVMSHVQNMVNYPYNNHGWGIRLSNESISNTYGVTFCSSNNTTLANRPTLVVNYVLPVEVSTIVTHATPGNNDGVVDAIMTEGSGTYSSFWLYNIYHYYPKV